MRKKLFDLGEIKQSHSVSGDEGHVERSRDKALSLRFLKEHYEKLASIKALAGHPPAPGETYFLFTENSFNAFTFVPYLLKEHDQIEELHLATYSINKRILLSFMRLVEAGKIGNITMLVSDSLKHQRPAVTDQLDLFAKTRSELQVTYAWNHSKILLCRCGDHHYVIEGSGNWSENARHEQYVFCNLEKLYTFRKTCIEMDYN